MSGAPFFASLLSGLGPAPRRYPITQDADKTTIYGPWRIYYDPPPIPSRNCDWHWQHDDFDGADDACDGRAGSCPSFAEALNECDEYEDETDTAPATLAPQGDVQ